MADLKISQLPAATVPLAGTEVLPIVQSGVTDQVTVANLTAGRNVDGSSFTVTGSTIPTNGLYLPAANTVGIATDGTLRVSVSTTAVTSTLNVGIGRAPTSILDVYGAAPILLVESSNASAAEIRLLDSGSGGNPNLISSAGLGMFFQTNGSAALTLSSAQAATFASDVTLSEGKLTITDTANERAVEIVSSSTSSSALFVNASSLVNGVAITAYSNSADTGAFSLLEAINDNTAATGAYCLYMKQDAANAFMNLVGTAAANTTDPISTLTTPGATYGFAQIDINGAKKWIQVFEDPS